MATSFLEVKNNAISTLASGITDVATSLTVASGEGALFPSSFPFHITIENEILSCTNRSTDVLTVVREQQGTSGVAHSVNVAVGLNVTAKSVTDLNTAVNAAENKIGTGASTPTANKVLRATGTGTSAWAQVNLSTDVTGTLPSSNISSGSDDDFLRIDGASVEGRSAAEVLTDIGAGAAAGSASIVTVGALNSGSITSGFTSIDVGAGAISTTGLVTAGSISTGGDVFIDSTPADTVYSGITASFVAGEALEDGEVVYLKAADTRVWKAVATAAATSRAIGMVVADQLSAGSAVTVLLQGFLRADTNFPTWTIGGALYTPEAETTGKNVPEQAAPDSDGDFIQILGWASDANTVYFNPSNDIIEHA